MNKNIKILAIGPESVQVENAYLYQNYFGIGKDAVRLERGEVFYDSKTLPWSYV